MKKLMVGFVLGAISTFYYLQKSVSKYYGKYSDKTYLLDALLRERKLDTKIGEAKAKSIKIPMRTHLGPAHPDYDSECREKNIKYWFASTPAKPNILECATCKGIGRNLVLGTYSPCPDCDGDGYTLLEEL